MQKTAEIFFAHDSELHSHHHRPVSCPLSSRQQQRRREGGEEEEG